MTWIQTSVSQINDYIQCPRYWHYRSIQKIREPKKPEQQRGDDVHDALEKYQNTGVTLEGPYWEYVSLAKLYLPTPGTAIAELEFLLPTYPGGPVFKGYIDLLEPKRTPIVRALDYKTKTKKSVRYIKTPKTLGTDPQMLSYAYAAFELGHAKDKIEVAHLNIVVDDKYPKVLPPISTILHESDVRGSWQDRFAVTREMQEASAVEDAQHLPPNTENCDAYNRPCFYKRQCGFDTKLFSITKGPNMSTPTSKTPSFIERLQAAKANGHAAAAAQSAAPVPAVVQVEGHDTVFIEAKDVQDQGGGNIVLVGEAAKIYAEALGYEAPAPGSGFHTTKQSLVDNAIEIRPAVVIATPVPKVKAAPTPAPAPAQGVLAEDAASRTTPIGGSDPLKAAPAATPEVSEPAPKKRGRPPKDKVVEGAAPVPSSASVDIGSTGVPAEAAPSASPTTKAMPRLGLQLFIDCLPTKRGKDAHDITTFEDWIAPIAEFVAESNGVDDYRLLQYGTGKVLLATEIRKRIATVPPVLVISSMSPGAHEAIDALIPYANIVVRALKG